MKKIEQVKGAVLDNLPRWELVRDCLGGAQAIKRKGYAYLPKLCPDDNSEDNKQRNEDYATRALFYNATAYTLAGLVGQVFSQDPVFDAPGLEMLETSANGGPVSLTQQAKRALISCLSFGRAGLLADYPTVEEPTTVQQLQDGKVRPVLVLYDPSDIINWHTVFVGGKEVLRRLVLRETYELEDAHGNMETKVQYRELALDEAGFYVVSIHRVDLPTGKLVVNQTFTPKGANGARLAFIPFCFIGAENNDADPDMAPLYDLAEVNIAHYRNSADYEESCHMAGQATPVLTGLDENWVTNVLKGRVTLGSRAAIPLPVGGNASLLQAQANSVPYEAMQHKERLMVSLGARIVEQQAVQRTATEASQENAANTSMLASCAKNVSAAYVEALKFCAAFTGTTDNVEFSLNTSFAIAKLASPDRQQVVSEWQAGLISFTEARDQFRKIGVATEDDDKVKAEADAIPDPMSPGNTDPIQ